jgi:predicted nucleic acid-binding protein
MKYLDATVFVYPILYDDKKADFFKDIIKSVALGDSGYTSTLTIDEVIWAVWKERSREEALKKATDILDLPNLQISPVSRPDSFNSIRLMKKYPHLKPRDATHLAVALKLGVDSIVSDDKDFDGIDELKRDSFK